MYSFQNIRELINALVIGKDLLIAMFGKRKAFDYRYDQAIEVLDQRRVDALIEMHILVRNGRYVEIEDQLLGFFEIVLDVNEEVNTAYINENIASIKENIDYFLTEEIEGRRYPYLKKVKNTLHRMGYICLRNIVDLKRQIDDAFKTEPNYKIKIKKLENYDTRRQDIKELILACEKIITEDEVTFFAVAKDDELLQISTELRLQLQSARHFIIDMEKQIINYLNQVKHQSFVLEKIRRIKYLKDQFELEDKTDIHYQLRRHNALVFEKRRVASTKVSLETLYQDATYTLICELNEKRKERPKLKVPTAKAIEASFFTDISEEKIFINIEDMKRKFVASGYHLFDFVMQYDYPLEVKYEDKVICYCQIISTYDKELTITDEYYVHNGSEFSVVYPK